MRKLVGALGLSVLSMVSAQAMATEVGVMNWREALLSSSSAQTSMNQLKNQIGPQQKRAEALAKEIQQLQANLQKDGEVMSESQRAQSVKQLREKGSEFQNLRQQIGQAQQQAEQAFLKSSKPKFDRAIEQVMSKHKLDLVVDRDAVVAIADSKANLDITKEVLQVFNSLK